MKVRLFAALAAVIMASALFSACKNETELTGTVQALDYNESTVAISNPDRGFYGAVYVTVNENGAIYNKAVFGDAHSLYHLRCDIGAFSAAVNGKEDMPLTQKAVDGLDGLLAYLRENDKNAIVRFAYDPKFGGSENKEPSLGVMLGHVRQICEVLNRYPNTVTAIETGLIGPWGEMHSSKIANAEHITPLADEFLTQTSGIPVLLRTPKMIYDYLQKKPSEAEDIVLTPADKAYMLGVYNDGYLGSENDLGTYTDRRRDIAFLSRQTAHLPFGGEVVVPESKLHDIEVCLPEMNELHLSYLNIAWNNVVIDKWKKSYYTQSCGSDSAYYGKTAFDYIESRMGYRFVLKNSVFYGSNAQSDIKIELSLQNAGFGNLCKKKRAKLLFTDESGAVAFECDAGEFNGENGFTASASPNLASGKYGIYLRLYGEEYNGVPLYCVRFANDGVWNAELKANKIGDIAR